MEVVDSAAADIVDGSSRRLGRIVGLIIAVGLHEGFRKKIWIMLLYDAIRRRTEIAWALVRHEETASSPWRKSRAAMRRGFGPGSRRRDAAVLAQIRASLDNEEPGPNPQAATARLLPRAARSAAGAETHLANRAALCGGIIALASVIDGERGYTQGHLRRVGMYSMELGRRIGVDATQLATLQMGGVLHDIGKAWIPRAILHKRSALTEQERATMQRHSVIGYELLKPLPGFRAVLPIVRWHHERLDGTGYPDGLAGLEIPLLTRIVSVADVFDALSTDRPYRKALTLEECKTIMTEEAHAGKLDGQLVAVLIKALPELSGIRGSGAHSALVARLMAEPPMSWERTSQRRHLHECPGNLVLN